MVCNEPILVVCKKLGVCKVDPAGKPCSTLFTRVSYNGTSSVVACECRRVQQSCSVCLSIRECSVCIGTADEDTGSLGKGAPEQRAPNRMFNPVVPWLRVLVRVA